MRATILAEKTALEFGVLVEIVQDTLRFGVALEFDGDGHALAVGFVTKIGNTVEFFFLTRSAIWVMNLALLT